VFLVQGLSPRAQKQEIFSKPFQSQRQTCSPTLISTINTLNRHFASSFESANEKSLLCLAAFSLIIYFLPFNVSQVLLRTHIFSPYVHHQQ
jgi:hypothetical protein